MEALKGIENVIKATNGQKEIYILDIHNVELKKKAYEIVLQKHQRHTCQFCGNLGDTEEEFYGSTEVISFISDNTLREMYEVAVYCKSCLSFVNSYVIPSKDVYKAYLQENPDKAEKLLIKIK